ncbi:MAG: lipid-A-disaccharide synthase N-terminal domain-containing protein [Burkholderiaceae bacterium]
MEHSPLWLVIGFVGQGLFSMRFVIQWLKSERAKKSIVPVAFWYFSLAGGTALLAYAIHRGDPVFIVGQGAGLLIYLRNLWLIYRDPRDDAAAA